MPPRHVEFRRGDGTRGEQRADDGNSLRRGDPSYDGLGVEPWISIVKLRYSLFIKLIACNSEENE
ncbi:MAG: hypothetical protein E6I91_09320 [Chloroflexi bacterium]|nr:MAG: hypothetical protein E6I91_09320 [Chloroflexota bacterium]